MIVKKIKSILFKMYIHALEKSLFGVKYLHIKKGSPHLLVIFSGFNPHDKRSYNYIRSLQNLNCDKLYVLDSWGYKGSYYWYENGSNNPEISVTNLLNDIVKKNGYKHLYTAGTSKGGTAAIYYGLKLGAQSVYAGACQYYIGTYLSRSEHIAILHTMMGTSNNEKINFLNDKLKTLIKEKENSRININLLYSKDEVEQTFQNDMYYLISDLKKYNIPVFEKNIYFLKHNDIGKYFPSFIMDKILL